LKEDSLREFVLDQLDGLGALECRGMFGGHGFYCDGLFFGILFEGRLYFKTDPASRKRYQALGMKPFRPTPRQMLRTYYEVPATVLESTEQLRDWARDAVASRASRA
jgi:DNA transformation protein